MCPDHSTKINFSSLPTMVLKCSSQTLRKKKQCQLQLPSYVKTSLALAAINTLSLAVVDILYLHLLICSSCAVERS